MPKFSSFDIEYTLVCDDVRREDNGKWLYLGVYAHNILVAAVPTNLMLSLVFRLKPKKVVQTDVEVRALLDGAMLSGIKGQIQFTEMNSENFPTPSIPIPIAHLGVLEFQVREGSSNWQSVLSIDVQQKPTA